MMSERKLYDRVKIEIEMSIDEVKYLFVGENEENSISELVLLKHTMELITSLADTLSIVRVDDKDESLRVLEVVSPQRSDLVLTADVPHSEADVLVLDRLDVEADGWNRRDDLAQL